jgi:hypothetical protein
MSSTEDTLRAARRAATIQLAMARTQCKSLFFPSRTQLNDCACTTMLLEATIRHLDFEIEHGGSDLTSDYTEYLRSLCSPYH